MKGSKEMTVDLEKLNSILNSTQIKDTVDEINEAKLEVAANTGLSPNKIHARLETYAHKNARKGVICALHIGRARFEQALTPPDLGIDTNDGEIQDYLASLSLGRRLLVAGEYKKHLHKLSAIEQRARRKLESCSIPTAWGRFVPYTVFQEMKEKIDEEMLNYQNEYQSVIYKLDEIRWETEAVLADASHHLFKMLKKDWTAIPPTEFTNSFVNKAMLAFPSRQEVEAAYQWNFEVSFVPVTQANQEMEAVMKLRTEAAEAKQQVVEHIKQTYQKQIGGFVADMMAHVRQLAYESVSTALAVYKKHGRLGGKTTESLKNVIAQIDALNIANDTDVIMQVRKLQSIVAQNESFGSAGETGLVLQELVEENRQFLLELGRQPRLTRRIETGETIESPVVNIRQVRKNAAKEDIPIDAPVRQQRIL